MLFTLPLATCLHLEQIHDSTCETMSVCVCVCVRYCGKFQEKKTIFIQFNSIFMPFVRGRDSFEMYILILHPMIANSSQFERLECLLLHYTYTHAHTLLVDAFHMPQHYTRLLTLLAFHIHLRSSLARSSESENPLISITAKRFMRGTLRLTNMYPTFTNISIFRRIFFSFFPLFSSRFPFPHHVQLIFHSTNVWNCVVGVLGNCIISRILP